MKGVEGDVEEADPIVWAGDISLGGASVPVEGTGPFKGGAGPESLGARLGPGMEGPRGADDGGAYDVHGGEPVSDSDRNTETGPADFHGSTWDRVEGLADVPTRRVQRERRFLRMFPGINELEEGSVRAPARPEAVLSISQYPVAFPRSSDPDDDETYPKLPEDLEEDEGSEAIQGDLGLGVLGLRAEPSPLEPRGCLRLVPEGDETLVGMGADRCRPSLDHIIGEPRGPWGGAAAVAGDDAVEFSQCWWGCELGGEVKADPVYARDVRESLPEEAAEVSGDAATGCVSEKSATIV